MERPEIGGKRQERAHRILDAAAVLVLRWGYDKTTIDDIAREAKVAKGTIYLHWKTREDLFGSLMLRERVALNQVLLDRLRGDDDGRLSTIMKYCALALIERPLLKAVILRDLQVLGKLAHTGVNPDAIMKRLAGFTTYLTVLRENHLVRTDLDMNAQIYIVSAVFMGFFLVGPLMPDELTMGDAELADLIAITLHRVLEHDTPDAAPAQNPFVHYVEHALATSQEMLDQALA